MVTEVNRSNLAIAILCWLLLAGIISLIVLAPPLGNWIALLIVAAVICKAIALYFTIEAFKK